MGAGLDGLKPLIVDLHGFFQSSLALGFLLATEETRLTRRRQVFEHQLLVVLLLIPIDGPHVVETGVIGQFTIYIIICLVVGAEGAPV